MKIGIDKLLTPYYRLLKMLNQCSTNAQPPAQPRLSRHDAINAMQCSYAHVAHGKNHKPPNIFLAFLVEHHEHRSHSARFGVAHDVSMFEHGKLLYRHYVY